MVIQMGKIKKYIKLPQVYQKFKTGGGQGHFQTEKDNFPEVSTGAVAHDCQSMEKKTQNSKLKKKKKLKL